MIDGQAPVETFDEIDSTILEARRRAERNELGPVWLIARSQTAGRGRRGRTWASLDGNLMATYLFATKRPPAEIALLSFATGLAIVETIDEVIGPGQASLKWPNDVLIGGAKASGIMLDSGSLGEGGLWAALAFGVNLAVAPEIPDQRTTSLRALLPPDAIAPEPLDFLASLRPKLEAYAARMDRDGFEPLRQAWLKRAHGLGQRARVVQGDQTLEGRIAGLSSRGELELDTVTGRRLITAGDVFLPNVA
ncbi:biotin--[acetyl-CoA-carboxylase] ligase [Terricaulis silvestris]|uniref:biotin--[biotin carboxyl-carrier protein] ligase n=1 Tax=Terricaulis silvestris TaxID=2686094 RepID=A0A6I6MJ48_9CAUL|nr:biotin--[acetyl-CoA-carboxylase] ligase [Terricaulis silvestris]QGZ95225.1 Bifunctional protein BirA [Terricaulis silvestris]